MSLTEALKKSVGKNEYGPNRLDVLMKVNNLRDRIGKGERATIPKEEPYENKITEYLTEEELKRKINEGAISFKSAIQQQYNDYILEKLKGDPQQYIQEARKQTEMMKILGNNSILDALKKTDPIGLLTLLQSQDAEKQRIELEKQNLSKKMIRAREILREKEEASAKATMEYDRSRIPKSIEESTLSFKPIDPIDKAPKNVRVSKGNILINNVVQPNMDTALLTLRKYVPDLKKTTLKGIVDDYLSSINPYMDIKPLLNEEELNKIDEPIITQRAEDLMLEDNTLVPERAIEMAKEDASQLRQDLNKEDDLYNEILSSPEFTQLRQKVEELNNPEITDEYYKMFDSIDIKSYDELLQTKQYIKDLNEYLDSIMNEINNYKYKFMSSDDYRNLNDMITKFGDTTLKNKFKDFRFSFPVMPNNEFLEKLEEFKKEVDELYKILPTASYEESSIEEKLPIEEQSIEEKLPIEKEDNYKLSLDDLPKHHTQINKQLKQLGIEPKKGTGSSEQNRMSLFEELKAKKLKPTDLGKKLEEKLQAKKLALPEESSVTSIFERASTKMRPITKQEQPKKTVGLVPEFTEEEWEEESTNYKILKILEEAEEAERKQKQKEEAERKQKQKEEAEAERKQNPPKKTLKKKKTETLNTQELLKKQLLAIRRREGGEGEGFQPLSSYSRRVIASGFRRISRNKKMRTVNKNEYNREHANNLTKLALQKARGGSIFGSFLSGFAAPFRAVSSVVPGPWSVVAKAADALNVPSISDVINK